MQSHSERSALLPGKEKSGTLNETVESSKPLTILPLLPLCVLTGLVNLTAYQATNVWPGFQTGCTTQIGARIPYWIRTGFTNISNLDTHLVTSLGSFCLGAFTGSLLRPLGLKAGTRKELLVRGLIQVAAYLVAGFLLFFGRNRPDGWNDGLGFGAAALISAAQGMQALDGQTVTTELATTVVQTSVWLSLFTLPLPQLFALRSNRKRDLRIAAIACLFFGGMIANALHDKGRGGAAAVMFLAAAVRFISALCWLVPPKSEK